MNNTSRAALRFRYRLEYLLLASLVGFIGRLSYSSLRSIASFLGAAAYLVDKRGRMAARANLDSAFGDRFTPSRKRQIAKDSYRVFARTMLELFWSPNFTREFAERMVVCEGLDRDACHRDDKAAAIYPCLHFSNFEWLGQYCAYAVIQGPIIAQRFKNPLIGPIFDRLRRSSGHRVIPQERAVLRMLKHLNAGGKFGMLSDLNLDPDEGAVIVESFGGLKASVTQTHAALALRTGAKIIPVECRPLPDGRYRMIYHKALEYPPDATAAEIVQLCWNVLEPSIHEQPECWLWAYKHWRFKPVNDSTGRYPYYANVAKRFDKLIKKQAANSANKAQPANASHPPG